MLNVKLNLVKSPYLNIGTMISDQHDNNLQKSKSFFAILEL